MSSHQRGIVISPEEGTLLLNPLGGQIIVKLRDGDTSGSYSMFDNIIPAQSPGPRPHLHRHHDETFYVLEGELAIQIGGEMITAAPGAVVVVPHGVPHRPSNRSSTPTRVLLVFSPGGMDHFFEDIAAYRIPMQTAPVASEPNDAVSAFCDTYGFVFSELPPLASRGRE